MSTTTTHLGLTKPDATDNITPRGFNDNFDKIDDEIFGLKTDYVVAQGIQGAWTYRRWASGIGECWCRYVQKTGNVWGSYTGCSVGDYPFQFTEIPSVTATFGVDSRGQGHVSHCSSTLSAPNIYASNEGAEVGLECWFNIHAFGRWKKG